MSQMDWACCSVVGIDTKRYVCPASPSRQLAALIGDINSNQACANHDTQSPEQNWSRVRDKNQAW